MQPVDPTAPDRPITEIILMQEDLRFVSANDFHPLNKLKHIQAVDVVHVLFSDYFKCALAAEMKARGLAPNGDEDLRCAESKDPVFQNLID